MAENKDFPKTFKLNKAGQFAIVRLLHSSVDTIETVKTHWVQMGDTWKHFKCVGNGCPACAAGYKVGERAYIRLYNYGTGEVEIWDRTTNQKFFDSLKALESDWGVLDEIVVKITRDSDEFPTYSVILQPSKNYPKPEGVSVDEKIAYRMVASRSAEDIKTFMDTGNMPPKKPYQPQTNNQPQKPVETSKPAPQSSSFELAVDEDDGDLPF